MAANPPATAQSGDSIAAAAAFVEAVLAELEVAVLVLELVLDIVVDSVRKSECQSSSAHSDCKDEERAPT